MMTLQLENIADPKEIREYLDQYIVGQEYAKKGFKCKCIQSL